MSSHHEPQEPWIDRWWLVLLILFGLAFALCLALFRPQHEWSSVTQSPHARTVVSAVLPT